MKKLQIAQQYVLFFVMQLGSHATIATDARLSGISLEDSYICLTKYKHNL
jgi:hypothetical protein